MRLKTKEEIEAWIKSKNITVYDSVPDGWVRTIGALTAPRGYFWANNGGNPFDGTCKRALIRER